MICSVGDEWYLYNYVTQIWGEIMVAHMRTGTRNPCIVCGIYSQLPYFGLLSSAPWTFPHHNWQLTIITKNNEQTSCIWRLLFSVNGSILIFDDYPFGNHLGTIHFSGIMCVIHFCLNERCIERRWRKYYRIWFLPVGDQFNMIYLQQQPTANPKVLQIFPLANVH
jgi:hypothetical protein